MAEQTFVYVSRLKEYNEPDGKPIYTQQAIAEMVGKTRQTIYRWYSDEPFELPDMQTAAKLAQLYSTEEKQLTPFDMLTIRKVAVKKSTFVAKVESKPVAVSSAK